MAPRVSSTVSRVQRRGIECDQGIRRVDGLGSTGDFEQIETTQLLHKDHNLTRQGLVDVGHTSCQNSQFFVESGVIDPVEQTAALEGVVHFAGTIAGDNHDGGVFGFDGA
jgi:hypothetical protein